MRVTDDLDELMATRRVVVKADRSRDPFEYIDELRQAREDDKQRIKVLWHHVRAIRPAKDWTDTGIWTAVKFKFGQEVVAPWVKWAVRGVLALCATTAVGVIGWVFKLAWQGLMK